MSRVEVLEAFTDVESLIEKLEDAIFHFRALKTVLETTDPSLGRFRSDAMWRVYRGYTELEMPSVVLVQKIDKIKGELADKIFYD